MSIYKTEWHGFGFEGDGTHTIEVNIVPADVGAQISMRGHNGSGLSFAGIKSFRKRLASGADEEHKFTPFTKWPAVIFDHISSVTFAIAQGAEEEMWVTARMDFYHQ